MVFKQNVLFWNIVVVVIFYILQGVIGGLISSIPLFLTSYKASWKQQGTFSWVGYPYSFKILWAPIIDSVYIHRFGRNQTWLIPIQFTVGIILLILSFYLESLLVNLEIVILTFIFLLICFLIASQDIVVDGWSVCLFSSVNPQWLSSCQTIGITVGGFIGSTVLLTFESSNFTNKYIREPLSLPHHSKGLFSIGQFILFFGFIFIIISIIMTFIAFLNNQSTNNIKIQKKKQTKLNLFETYNAILELFKNQYIRQLIFILFTCHIGHGATYFMTSLILLE
jgi:PAT family acetyl-CoA transporter-like MFS transporter 1